MTQQHLNVRKSDGKLAHFNEKKLHRSLRQSGADHETANDILEELRADLYDGISTQDIYKMAFRKLRGRERSYAARYSLKQALFEFGPSGYPFENYIAKLWQSEGFQTQVGLILDGQCVSHEIDVLGEKEGVVRLAECKFHSQTAHESDVKISLYVHSRFRDLTERFERDKVFPGKKIEGWLFTNTRFTDDALQYGNCSGMHLVGWNIPVGYALKDIVDRTGLHPITCLTTLTRAEKQVLLGKGIVLARELPEHRRFLEQNGMTGKRLETVLREANDLSRK